MIFNCIISELLSEPQKAEQEDIDRVEQTPNLKSLQTKLKDKLKAKATEHEDLQSDVDKTGEKDITNLKEHNGAEMPDGNKGTSDVNNLHINSSDDTDSSQHINSSVYANKSQHLNGFESANSSENMNSSGAAERRALLRMLLNMDHVSQIEISTEAGGAFQDDRDVNEDKMSTEDVEHDSSEFEQQQQQQQKEGDSQTTHEDELAHTQDIANYEDDLSSDNDETNSLLFGSSGSEGDAEGDISEDSHMLMSDAGILQDEDDGEDEDAAYREDEDRDDDDDAESWEIKEILAAGLVSMESLHTMGKL